MTNGVVRRLRHIGEGLAAFLNEPPAHSRLEERKITYPLVMGIVSFLQRDIETFHFGRWSLDFPKLAHNADEASERAFHSATEKYEEDRAKLLERIRFTPNALLATSRRRYHYIIEWRAITRSGRWVPHSKRILDVLTLAEHGLLHRLRKCA